MVKMISGRRQQGYSLLLISFILLVVCSMVILYTSNGLLVKQQIMNRTYAKAQAFAAAQAGLDFGTIYLQKYRDIIILDSNNDGYIDNYGTNATTQVVQADNTQYSITYTNITPYDYKVIQIKAIGWSADKTVTQTIGHTVYLGGETLLRTQSGAVNILRAVNLNGNANVFNYEQLTSVRAGGSVSLAGNSSTQGTIKNDNGNNTLIISRPNNLKADISQNDNTYQSYNGDAFFQSYFKANKATIKNQANLKISNSRGTNISAQLNGKKGQLIWVDQTGGPAQINGNTNIGSPSEPVILIINGEVKISGNVVIYGLLYVASDWSNDGGGNVNVYGNVGVEGNFNTSGNFSINYDKRVFDYFTNGSSAGAVIPGSWRDFKWN